MRDSNKKHQRQNALYILIPFILIATRESGAVMISVLLINRGTGGHATCPSQTGNRRQSWYLNPGSLGPRSTTLCCSTVLPLSDVCDDIREKCRFGGRCHMVFFLLAPEASAFGGLWDRPAELISG